MLVSDVMVKAYAEHGLVRRVLGVDVDRTTN